MTDVEYRTADVEAVIDGDALRFEGQTADEWIRTTNPAEIEQ